MRWWYSVALVFAATSCATPEPSKEQAAVALVELADAHDRALWAELLAGVDRASDAGAVDAAAIPPSATSSAGTTPPAKTPSASTPAMRKRTIIVEDLRCARVDRATHRCEATWRFDRAKGTTSGRYLFTRHKEAWTAVDEKPK